MLVATMSHDEQNCVYVCSVCDYKGKMDKRFFNSNIVDIFCVAHNMVSKWAKCLNVNNAIGAISKGETTRARQMGEKRHRTKTFAAFNRFTDPDRCYRGVNEQKKPPVSKKTER